MKSVIIGAGTYGEVYLSYLQEAGIEVIGFLDDNDELIGKLVCNLPVLGKIISLPLLKSQGVEAVYCPIGNNELRVRFLKYAIENKFRTPNFIHPTVFISPKVKIKDNGIYILPNVTIMPFVTINNYVMISVNSIISHHTILDEGVFISFGVNVGASINLKEFAYIGIGASIMTGIKEVGRNSMIGAGAVVIKDVPMNTVVAGVPAKIIKYKE